MRVYAKKKNALEEMERTKERVVLAEIVYNRIWG